MNYHTEHHMYAAVPCYNLGSCIAQLPQTCRVLTRARGGVERGDCDPAEAEG